MPQAGVSVSRGHVRRDDGLSDAPGHELPDPEPYTGPRPVRAGASSANHPRPVRAASAAESWTPSARADAAARVSDRPRRIADRTPRAADRTSRVADRSPQASPRSPRADGSRGASEGPRAVGRAPASPPASGGVGVPGRRTVTIQGRGAERYKAGPARRRPAQRPYERTGFRPDRAAMWAVMLGVLLVLIAATSSRAAVGAHHAAAGARVPITLALP